MNDVHDFGKLFDALKEKLSRTAARVAIWRNKLIGMISLGATHDRNDSFYKWGLGDTERHCTDCARLNGTVLTASEWSRAGIRPQSPDLACGGWRCDCRLTVSDGPSDGLENL